MNDILNKPVDFLEKIFSGASEKTDNPDEMPTFLTDLTEESKNLRIISTRREEIKKIIDVLSRREKGNPILIGESGVGKTAIVEQLSYMVANKLVPSFLLGYKIYSLDFNDMMANTGIRGIYEGKVNSLKNFLKKRKSILFIDEIHSVYGYNKIYESGHDILSILKTDLAKGKIRIIGTATSKEFTSSIEKDPALSRRVQIIYINETSDYETAKILFFVKKDLETFHNVKISDDAIKSCLVCAKRFVLEKKFPDKAIELLDLACSKNKIDRHSKMTQLSELENKIEDLSSVVYLGNLSKKKAKEIEQTTNILKQKQESLVLEVKSENQLLNNFLSTKKSIEKLKKEIEELKKEFKLDEISFKENVELVKEEEKLNYIYNEIKKINPQFKLEILPDDIYETLEIQGIVKKEMFDSDFFKQLARSIKKNVLIRDIEIEKIVFSIERNFNQTMTIKNKLLSLIVLIEQECSVSDEIISNLNNKISFKTEAIYISMKDIFNKDIFFWKEKINAGARVFVLNIDKFFISYGIDNLIYDVLKNGFIKNQNGISCSFAGCVFFLRILESNSFYQEELNKETMSNLLNKNIGEISEMVDEVILMPKFSKLDKFNIFLQYLNKLIPNNKISIEDSFKKKIVAVKNFQELIYICKQAIIDIKNTEKTANRVVLIEYDEESKQVYIIKKQEEKDKPLL